MQEEKNRDKAEWTSLQFPLNKQRKMQICPLSLDCNNSKFDLKFGFQADDEVNSKMAHSHTSVSLLTFSR